MQQRKTPVCNVCTVRLVENAYRKAPWFRVIREPLLLAMRFMAYLYRIDPDQYEVRTQSCHRCMRFNKIALKEKSALFRVLNHIINPAFDTLIERILTRQELLDAEHYAHSAMTGPLYENTPEHSPDQDHRVPAEGTKPYA